MTMVEVWSYSVSERCDSMWRSIHLLAGLLMLALAATIGSGCAPRAEPPAYAEVIELTGSPYERGFQHGERFADKIRSLYTILIETSLVPFLNREQDDVMNFLTEYQDPLYQDGRFSYELLKQSGQNLLEIMRETHPEMIEELKGLRDGSGMPFEQLLVLNTFVDTMLPFRSVTFFIRQLQAPRIENLEFMADLSSDGLDNNCDGQIDEADDHALKSHTDSTGWTTDYQPRTRAALVEVPPDARLRITFFDPPGIVSFEDPDAEPKEGEYQGMDPDSIRILVNDTLYTSADGVGFTSALWGEDDMGLEVIFSPPGGWPEAAEVSLYIQAANISEIVNPPPVHPRVMRDERITFTTRGYGKPLDQVLNRGLADEGTQPPGLAFAIRGSATDDGQIRLAQHFALLDSNISHKHTVLLVHRPDDGPAFCTLGWTGLIWGFSGMNEEGLAYAVTPSDSLDNPFAGQVKNEAWLAKLLATGTPVGIKGRQILQQHETVQQARATLAGQQNTFGWNFMLADATGDMLVAELDANILGDPDGGMLEIGPDPADPENLDSWGRHFASVGGDDLRMGMHFTKNVPDIETQIIVFDVQPQFLWSSFYYRSLKAHARLGEEIRKRYGGIGLAEAIEILRTPELVDNNESMNAAVFEPERGVVHWSMGQVPATDGTFHEFDLRAPSGDGS